MNLEKVGFVTLEKDRKDKPPRLYPARSTMVVTVCNQGGIEAVPGRFRHSQAGRPRPKAPPPSVDKKSKSGC